MNRTSVQILPVFFLTVAAAILLIPLPWLLAWILAAAIHELFHLLAIFLFKYRVLSVTIGAGGAKIETDMMPGVKMSACALAGPVGGLLLLQLLHITPRLAICGLIQSVYNLLPLCHLDGGRVIYGVLAALFQPETANQIAVMLERIIIFMLVIAAVYAFVVLHLGIIPLFFVSFLLFKNKKFLANKPS